MKIGFIGDLHLQKAQPPSRADDWVETTYRKISWLNTVPVDILVCTGDLVTQRPLTVSTLLFAFRILAQIQKPFYSIVGNHDQITTTDSVLDLVPSIHSLDVVEIDDVVIFGVPYGQTAYPVPVPDRFNILVLHEMITPATKELLGCYHTPKVKGFDLYIVGHYHEPFVLTTPEGKDVINPGVVLRGRADEADIQSKLVIFDTETKSVEFVDIPQARNVFVERVETVLEHVVYTLRDLQHITLSNWLEEAPEDIKPILMEYVIKVK